EQQGLIQATNSISDLAINGNGFFAVSSDATNSTGGDLVYTRAGSFTTDTSGYLRNAGGYYLQGWRLDAAGNIPANRNDLELINLDQFSGTAEASTSVAMRANLTASQAAFGGAYAAGVNTTNMAGGTITPHFERTVEFVDSQGGAQPLRLAFLKTAANTWQYEFIYDGAAANVTTGAGLPIASGTVTFNGDGTIATPAVGTPPTATLNVAVPWSAASGLQAQTLDFDFGTVGTPTGLTQYDGESAVISTTVNGSLYGNLTGMRVDDAGRVYALFDNGAEEAVYQIPIVTFPNPNGLGLIGGNAYITSNESGIPTLQEANVGGAGRIEAQALESSTVDLAQEFTDLITTQRAYSAATRIITTSDEMLEEVIRIKR
ncbi:MAG: flagellar hook protein FlgE, partial [Pseudomonadota bacterium]